ncbi:uncharacterized protein A1O5_09544 [Cladophialophora psammophila CBS 110553]|uniref:CID domain-containing protein n=1 Tax=Cladophialophora psammophila CBS 110553 TaxID=1182543 RepID=W9WS97_9EURO|nr:uncharacterized protein A1O5_09544 [Cladophialophora psammophila CBS 110553]EXJ67531.1 hypothetical protein A1O5_09544 [Cladophialophora psammophila CBS 110553]
MPLSNNGVSSKVGASTKKSIFERQKAEAEAKKAREKAETAAVLEDFVKSFEDDGNRTSSFPSKRGTGSENRGGFGSARGNYGPSGPGKRHFTSSGLKGGPGTLGPSPSLPKSGPGSLGSAPGFGKKRHYDEYSGRDWDRERDRDRDRRDRVFSYSDGRDADNRRDSRAFAHDDEEDTRDTDELKAAAKPTLHLSSLPPGTSPAVVKALFTPSPLTVENVRILPPGPGSTTERKSISAIVTLVAETPAADIETVVSHLQNKYLGFGFNLSISRHLSSAALTGISALGSNVPSANLNNLPFGAKPIPQHTSLSRAPPPNQGSTGHRFAPPASYTSSTSYGPRPMNNLPPTQVTVQAPNDLKQLRLIHKTIEALLTYGPEFEALLMSRPQIQCDERWAWLWNSRSVGGVYYRWRLWEILTDAKSRRKQRYTAYGTRQPQGDILFEGQATWIPPEEDLKFEYTTHLEEFISDEDYNSSDEEDIDDDRGGGLARRYHDHQKVANVNDSTADNDGTGYLNPLAKTKLIHLLSRLPETNAKLRRGDVARVTGFAIEHAGAGADEVAELVTRNVVRPFCYCVTRPKGDTEAGDDHHDGENGDGTPKHLWDKEPSTTEEPNQPSKAKEMDTTPASLIGLYLISDILSASSTSGVRHAWRYRSLLQHQLLAQNVLPVLGKLPQKYEWGKLKAEKWKRQVQVVLGLWEGWCVFEEARMKEMVEGFLHPPLSEQEQKAKAEQEAERDKEKEREKAAVGGVSRWRSVGDAVSNSGVEIDGKPIPSTSALAHATRAADDGDVEMSMDGTPMADDDDGDGAEAEAGVDVEFDDDGDTVLTDENIDGVPMADSSDDEHEDGEEARRQKESQLPLQEEGGSNEKTAPEAELEAKLAMAARLQAQPQGDSPDRATKPASVPSTTVMTTSQGRRIRPKAVDFDDMFE